jgi:hypothetical protein
MVLYYLDDCDEESRGLGRIVALCYDCRPSTSHQIFYHIRYLSV